MYIMQCNLLGKYPGYFILLLIQYIRTLHSVLISCMPCQPVLIVSTSNKKYRFGVPSKVLTKQVGLYFSAVFLNEVYVHEL